MQIGCGANWTRQQEMQVIATILILIINPKVIGLPFFFLLLLMYTQAHSAYNVDSIWRQMCVCVYVWLLGVGKADNIPHSIK